MRMPICEMCAKTNVLCAGCEKKLKEGKINDIDVKVSRLLYQLKDKYELENADFYKSIDLGRVVLILTRGDVGLLIGREGKVVAEISNAIGKKVRIVEVGKDIKKAIYDIVAPARVVGINKVYRNGEETYKVRFLKSDAAHLPVDITSLEAALSKLLEAPAKVQFE